MDLRSIINTEAADNSAPKQVTPVTPVQPAPPQQTFREYNPSPAGHIAKQPSLDYGPRSSDPYASPTSYHPGHHGRASNSTPLQPLSQNDLRSPAGSYSAQSPYIQPTPSSSISGPQYNYPHGQLPQSPAQAHPYANTLQHRESHPYGHPPPAPLSGAHQVIQSSIGNPPAYLQQQRSHSSHSESTPTSAHSQQQYFPPLPHDSPASRTSFGPPQVPPHQRHQSQPQTPLGPPASISRQTSGSFPQPTSPYLQRPPSSGGPHHAYPAPHMSTPPSLQHQNTRPPTTPSAHSSRHPSIAESVARSQSARERSVSVSPKTKVATLHTADSNSSYIQPGGGRIPSEPSLKREGSGDYKPVITPRMANGRIPLQQPVTPAQPPPRKRVRYTEPPIWAQSILAHKRGANGVPRAGHNVNGKQPGRPVISQAVNGHPEAAPVQINPAAVLEDPDAVARELLADWEPTITGNHVTQSLTKTVGDFFFEHVVNRPDAGELASRNVEIEIEAKLGQLLHADTKDKFDLPVMNEVVLSDRARTTFQSSMTEAQHKALNEYLNRQVQETHPNNPANATRPRPRIPIVYAHRRETDRFYELPASSHSSLPACIRRQLNPRHPVKVRVTHDQKSGELLAKIIKVRVADLNIFAPQYAVDWRISINFEMRWDGDIEGLQVPVDSRERMKDRLSYRHGEYQIDLTQVTMPDAGQRVEKEHELEIELAAAQVREQGMRALNGLSHAYTELVEGMLDNVRLLARNVPAPTVTL